MSKLYLEVSEHAVVRWLERVHGMDIDKVRKEIHDAAYPAALAGATKISVRGVSLAITPPRPGKPSHHKMITTATPYSAQPSNTQVKRMEAGER